MKPSSSESTWRRLTAVSTLVVPFTVAAAASADPTPAGPAFTVNAYTTDDQNDPDVAAAADGSFLVVWEGDRSAGGDGSGSSTQARLLDEDGAPLSGDTQVNTTTLGGQGPPAVAALAGGGFAVAWGGGGQGRLVDAAGSPTGGEFAYSSDSEVRYPELSGSPDGGFVVVWHGGYGVGVTGRRMDASGAALGGEFQVTGSFPPAANFIYGATVAHDGAGDFAVAWAELSLDPFAEEIAIRARMYGSDGSPMGSTLDLATAVFDSGELAAFPDVIGTDDGFLVAWTSEGMSASDAAGSAIEARSVSKAGALGTVHTVNEIPTGDQSRPRLAPGADGIVATWWIDGAVPRSIAARELALDGSPVGSEVEIAAPTEFAFEPAIAGRGTGDVLVAWGTDGTVYDADGDRGAVRGRLAATGAPCTDSDGDGFALEGGACGPVDCDDTDPAVNPGADEELFNGVDDDCDPSTPRNPACQSVADPDAGVSPSGSGLVAWLAAPLALAWAARRRTRSAAPAR